MTPAKQFLADHGLRPEALDREALLQSFDLAMRRGLDGAPVGLAMIPGYVTVDRPVPADRPVAVIDAGGTNLRVALIRFDAAGAPHIEALSRHAMPGVQAALSADAFFDALADAAAPLASRSATIGFCFSYPAAITPDCDARLLQWTKQIKAPSVVGMMVGSGLRARLARRGVDRPVTVLNDTVATLLAGRSAHGADRFASFVGFILGTGTNTAYVEHNRHIRKCPDLAPRDAMIVNVESGGFAGAPRSRFDERFDATTADPGAYMFEKMIAGAYLGGLGGTLLREAARAGLFSAAATPLLQELPAPSSKSLDDFCADPSRPAPPFDALPFTDNDRRLAQALCAPLYTRAALFTAVNISAAVIRSSAGRDLRRPVGVTIDGSTYYRTRTLDYPAMVGQHLQALLAPRGIHCERLHVDEAPLIGAAVAGLTCP